MSCSNRRKIRKHQTRPSLDHVFEEKVPGIMMDSELNFEEYIPLKVKKANAIMGVIRRNFSFLNGNLFKKLCNIS